MHGWQKEEGRVHAWTAEGGGAGAHEGACMRAHKGACMRAHEGGVHA